MAASSAPRGAILWGLLCGPAAASPRQHRGRAARRARRAARPRCCRGEAAAGPQSNPQRMAPRGALLAATLLLPPAGGVKDAAFEHELKKAAAAMRGQWETEEFKGVSADEKEFVEAPDTDMIGADTTPAPPRRRRRLWGTAGASAEDAEEAAEARAKREAKRRRKAAVAAGAMNVTVTRKTDTTPIGWRRRDLTVISVRPGSPAAEAGMISGWTITKLSGNDIRSGKELDVALSVVGTVFDITLISPLENMKRRDAMQAEKDKARQERRRKRREEDKDKKGRKGGHKSHSHALDDDEPGNAKAMKKSDKSTWGQVTVIVIRSKHDSIIGWNMRSDGLTVSSVSEGSPAAEAGVEVGWVLKAIDSEAVDKMKVAEALDKTDWVFSATFRYFIEGAPRPQRRSIPKPEGGAFVYMWYVRPGLASEIPEFRSLLTSVRSLRSTGCTTPIIVVAHELPHSYATILEKAGVSEIRSMDPALIPSKRIRALLPPKGVDAVGCQSTLPSSRCNRVCRGKLLRVVSLAWVMDLRIVVLVHSDTLWMQDPTALLSHHQPAIAVGRGDYEPLPESELDRYNKPPPDVAGPWIWSGGDVPNDLPKMEQVPASSHRRLNSGVVIIRPGGNVVASLVGLVTRHGTSVCSATTIFAAALQAGALQRGLRYHDRKTGEQCTASSFCGTGNQRRSFQRHAAWLRVPALHSLHASVMLIGPWNGLSSAVLSSRRALVQGNVTLDRNAPISRLRPGPMVLHRCCQRRSDELAEEEALWERDLLRFAPGIPVALGGAGEGLAATLPVAQPAG